MKKLSPQEKKELSYAKDRRNRFGQHAKASRKLIPLRKKKSQRSSRHAAKTITREAGIDANGQGQIKAEAYALAVDKKRWQKEPDVTLKSALSGKKEWRVRRFKRKQGAGVSNAKLAADPEQILRKQKKPNKSLEPTRMLVTDPAAQALRQASVRLI